MEIEKRTYGNGLHGKEGTYIHRYYLPQQYRCDLQCQDIAVLNEKIKENLYVGKSVQETMALMLAGPCTIRYRAERLVKEIPIKLLEPAVDACIRYYHDKHNWSLTAEETNFLLVLNERLRRMDHDINTECFRLNREMLARQDQGEPFLDDYEIEVKIRFQLCDNHPLSSDEDDNFVYEGNYWNTALKEDLQESIQNEREKEIADWNDMRCATNLEISNSPISKVSHCWLFHGLLSHSPVPLKHLYGIGTIWVEIQVYHQGFIKICNAL